VLYSEDIDEMGKDYYMESRDHAEIVHVISGNLIKGFMVITGCKTVGAYWDWLRKHSLCVRYWEKIPTEQERKSVPWKPYVLIDDRKTCRLTEEEFEEIKTDLIEKQVSKEHQLMFERLWESSDNRKVITYKN
jgi:hypothetical protein